VTGHVPVSALDPQVSAAVDQLLHGLQRVGGSVDEGATGEMVRVRVRDIESADGFAETLRDAQHVVSELLDQLGVEQH
jgi:hypothetical protein